MYYLEGVTNSSGFHILGQAETQMSFTLDGMTAKQALGKAIGETNTAITPTMDILQEAQVFTTGIPAEIRHSAGGAYNMTTKSGTNEASGAGLHFLGNGTLCGLQAVAQQTKRQEVSCAQ